MLKKIIICSSLFISNILYSEESLDIKKEEINKVIEQYILNNPEIIIKSLDNFSEKREKINKELSENNLKNFYKKKNYAKYPSIGSKTENLLIEFIDYNCGYCKKTLNTINKLVNELEDIKIVFVDFPILSESSELAARAALAAEKQGFYFKYHSALLINKKPLTEKFLIDTAKKFRLDLEKFKKDMNSKEIKEKIINNIKLAQDLQIRGTPTFIVGSNILPGAYDYDKLKSIILNNI